MHKERGYEESGDGPFLLVPVLGIELEVSGVVGKSSTTDACSSPAF